MNADNLSPEDALADQFFALCEAKFADYTIERLQALYRRVEDRLDAETDEGRFQAELALRAFLESEITRNTIEATPRQSPAESLAFLKEVRDRLRDQVRADQDDPEVN
jgi:hypothetical protein